MGTHIPFFDKWLEVSHFVQDGVADGAKAQPSFRLKGWKQRLCDQTMTLDLTF